MLALKRSLFNTEYILINVLMALASTISKCSLHVILLSHNTGFPIVVTFLKEKVFTGHCIETAVLLLLPAFVAAKMFTDILLLL
jgi:hypothetical protein